MRAHDLGCRVHKDDCKLAVGQGILLIDRRVAIQEADEVIDGSRSPEPEPLEYVGVFALCIHQTGESLI